MRSCFFRPIWSTKQRERFLDNRARVTAADLHDRLIGFKAAREALFAALEGEWMEWRLRFHHILLSTPSLSVLLKVGHFSHLLWLRCCAVQWRFRWFPLPNLKLLEFFSFSPLPLLAKCRRVRRRRKRLRQTERRKRRKRFAAPTTMIDSLPPFFSSVYFCPFRNFEKKGWKTRWGSFPSILIIVRDAR